MFLALGVLNKEQLLFALISLLSLKLTFIKTQSIIDKEMMLLASVIVNFNGGFLALPDSSLAGSVVELVKTSALVSMRSWVQILPENAS